MTIVDGTGRELFVLPECARCDLKEKNPIEMDFCPVLFCDECRPLQCNHYCERWKEAADDE